MLDRYLPKNGAASYSRSVTEIEIIQTSLKKPAKNSLPLAQNMNLFTALVDPKTHKGLAILNYSGTPLSLSTTLPSHGTGKWFRVYFNSFKHQETTIYYVNAS